jgi:RimJ/RimL family protein N-acetyltransferase
MLRLIPATSDTYAALALGQVEGLIIPDGGVEPPDTLTMLTGHAATLTRAQGWGCWLMLRDDVIVGSCAVKAPLAKGQVEIGYGVAPAARAQGVATAAVALLLAELRGRGVARVRAETAVINLPSQGVLRANGFMQTGRRHDAEDGELILWLRRL